MPTMLSGGLLCAISLGLKKQQDSESQREGEGQQGKSDDEVVLMIKHARLAEMKQNPREAEVIYHRAIGILNIYEQNKTWETARILQARVYIYDCMANLAMSQLQLEKAEKLYKETMKGLLQQDLAKDDDAVVEISLKLAMIYAMTDRPKEAEDGYKYCIETQEKKIPVEVDSNLDDALENSFALLGMATDAYSRFLRVQNKLPESLEYLTRAFSIAKSVFGNEHPQIAVLLNDIATAEIMMKNTTSAKQHLDRAVKIAQATESPDLATFLCNLGAVCMARGELKDAKTNCERALRVAMVAKNEQNKKQAKFCLEKLKKEQK